MIRGSTPTTSQPARRATTGSPSSLAARREATSSAAAPSVIPEALPAVTVPPSRKTGLSLASESRVTPARGCSSRSIALLALPAGHRDRHDLGREAAARPGALGPPLALQGEGVGRGAADPGLDRQLLGGLAHHQAGERVVEAVAVHAVHHLGVPQPIPPAGARQEVGGVGHALGAAGEHHLGLAGQDRARRAEDRLEARAAGLVDGVGRAVDRHAGAVGDLPRGVGAAAGLAGVAEDHLIDSRRLAAGPLEGGLGRGGAEVGGRERRERAAELADRRPHRRGEDDVVRRHRYFPTKTDLTSV